MDDDIRDITAHKLFASQPSADEVTIGLTADTRPAERMMLTTDRAGAIECATLILEAAGMPSVEAMVDALDFYANPETYHGVLIIGDRPCGDFTEDLDDGHGHPDYRRPMPGTRARRVLFRDYSDVAEHQCTEECQKVGHVVRGPFNEDQVRYMQAWQKDVTLHPYTCAVHGQTLLEATSEGWTCSKEGCTYVQDWAHSFTVEPPSEEEIAAEVNPHDPSCRQGQFGLGYTCTCLGKESEATEEVPLTHLANEPPSEPEPEVAEPVFVIDRTPERWQDQTITVDGETFPLYEVEAYGSCSNCKIHHHPQADCLPEDVAKHQANLRDYGAGPGGVGYGPRHPLDMD